jgi:hypothetical protein
MPVHTAQVVLSVTLIGLSFYWLPFVDSIYNVIRCGAYTSICWMAIVYAIAAFELGACRAAMPTVEHGVCEVQIR